MMNLSGNSLRIAGFSISSGAQAMRLLNALTFLGCVSYILLIASHKYGLLGASKSSFFFWTMLVFAMTTSFIASSAGKAKQTIFALTCSNENRKPEELIDEVLASHDVHKGSGLHGYLKSQMLLSYFGGLTLTGVSIGAIYWLL